MLAEKGLPKFGLKTKSCDHILWRVTVRLEILHLCMYMKFSLFFQVQFSWGCCPCHSICKWDLGLVSIWFLHDFC